MNVWKSKGKSHLHRPWRIDFSPPSACDQVTAREKGMFSLDLSAAASIIGCCEIALFEIEFGAEVGGMV